MIRCLSLVCDHPGCTRRILGHGGSAGPRRTIRFGILHLIEHGASPFGSVTSPQP
jgi:hypothetical protein